MYWEQLLYFLLIYICQSAVVTRYFTDDSFSFYSCPMKTMYLKIW